MTTEMQNKIREELNKAFVHCGETDAEYINEKVENELETLMCLMAGSYPETIQTDRGEMVGYLINIAVGSGAAADEIVALNMVVAKDAIHYVINSYIATKPEGWQPGDRKRIENEANRIVNLADVDPSIFN